MTNAVIKAASVAALLGLAAASANFPAASQTPQAEKPDLNGSWTFRLAAPPRQDSRGICAGPRCGAGPAGPASAASTGLDPAAAAGRRAQFPKYKPEFLAKVDELDKTQVNTDPALRCQNPGLPRVGTPDKIVQTADQVVFLYEDLNGSFWRIIPTDGRAHREDAEEGPFGDSVGRWEGGKLVVETVALGEDTWLTDNGAFHTYNMATTEEISLTPEGGLHYKITVNDPDVLAEPFVKERTLIRNTRDPLQPPPCVERSIDKMVGIESYHPNARW